MELFCGIDVGSTTTKCVITSKSGEIVAWHVMPTGYDPERSAKEAFHEALSKAQARQEFVKAVVSTGYGRKLVSWATKQVTEITCHARGAKALFPSTRTVIDIGGQDSKAIKLDSEGRVLDFSMNDKCAAGTGRFLENLARALNLSLEEMTAIALQATHSHKISSMCTVFAESEVISLLHQGKERDSIIKGLFEAVVSRVLPLALRLGIEEEVTVTGGVARNKGVIKEIEKALGLKVNVPQEPQIVGALGAAIIASQKKPQGVEG